MLRIGPLGSSVKQMEYATTSTRRFPANQIPTFRFSALLNKEAPEVKLRLASC